MTENVTIAFLFFHLSDREALPNWDKQIQNLCFQVNTIIEKVSQNAPEWMAKATEQQMVQWKQINISWYWLLNSLNCGGCSRNL